MPRKTPSFPRSLARRQSASKLPIRRTWDGVGYRRLVSSYLEFLLHHRGVVAGTCISAERVLRRFGACLRERRRIAVSECVVEDLDAFASSLVAGGLKRKTVGGALSVLRGFLRYLFDEGHLERDMAALVEAPRVFSQTWVPRSLSWDQVQQLIAAVGRPQLLVERDRAIVLMLATYGLRPCEVLRIRVDDIDWSHDVLSIRERKSGQPLQLPLTPPLREALQGWLRDRPQTEETHVFVTIQGRPLNRSGIFGVVRYWGRRAGLGRVYPYMLRHSTGRHLMEEGVPVSQIAKLLGHSTTQATQTYLRISLDQLRDVADNYGDLLGPRL